MAVGQVGFKDQRKVKRIHVEKRENPIVNRLNKTKVEKYPDLAMEKEARLKELRIKDRDAQQARVRCFFPIPEHHFAISFSLPFHTSVSCPYLVSMLTLQNSEKRKHESPKSERRKPTSGTMHTMISSRKTIWQLPATRIGPRISSTISSRPSPKTTKS